MFMFFFALMYSIKGGLIGQIFHNADEIRKNSILYDRILDGKVLSTLMVFLLCWLLPSIDASDSLKIAFFWLLAVSPSIGEEAGAVGNFGGGWGDYIEHSDSFGRLYGVKKALQRGVWMGACMAVATGYIPFIWWSALFPLCHFVGQEAYYIARGKTGWAWAEPIVGAVCFGVPFAGFFKLTVF